MSGLFIYSSSTTSLNYLKLSRKPLQRSRNSCNGRRTCPCRFTPGNLSSAVCTDYPLQVTGVSGFLGFRILAFALEAGYRVRGVVRRQAQIDTIKAAPSAQPYLDNLEFVVIPDLLKEGAFDEALEGVTYILHCASPIPRASAPVRIPWPFTRSIPKSSSYILSNHVGIPI